MNKVWNIGIYARVSTEKIGQSESVSAQIGNFYIKKTGPEYTHRYIPVP